MTKNTEPINSVDQPGETATRLLLARHGQTPWNQQRLIQGHKPVPLSPLGRTQAEELALHLAKEPLAAVYSSDLRRAEETATIAVRNRGLKVRAVPELRECGYGAWEGLSSYIDSGVSSPHSKHEQRVPRVGPGCQIPHPNAAPGGETLIQTLARFRGAIHEIADRHRGQTILVVSHDGPIRAWITQVLGWRLEQCWDIDIANCGVTMVEVSDKGPTVLRLGGTVRGHEGNSPLRDQRDSAYRTGVETF